MCSKKQVRHIFRTNDRIYIDTCILMNADTLNAFFERYSHLMEKDCSQIIIPTSVRKEIARLLCSNESEKRDRAMEGISVINRYSGLILMEGGSLPEEGLGRVHADPEIIATLTLGRKTERQVLITNDMDLAADVNGRNELRSCKGKPITVCYIDYEGCLKLSDCVIEHAKYEAEQTPVVIETSDENLICKEPEMNGEAVPSVDEEADTTTENCMRETESVGDGISAFSVITGMMAAGIAGYRLHKHRHEIVTLFKWVMKVAS